MERLHPLKTRDCLFAGCHRQRFSQSGLHGHAKHKAGKSRHDGGR